MAITCPRCGANYDATLFQFGHRVRCGCGVEVSYPGVGLGDGHIAADERPPHSFVPPKEQFLREAIRLSIEKMQANEGGPFGAVIVRDDEIVGRGWNRVTSTNDPTAHAEIVAIRDACANLKTFTLAGCEIYASCEPCPMCLAAIYWARLDRIYYAATCADATAAGFDDSPFYRELNLPAGSRSLAMIQDLRDEACEAFRLWVGKQNRVMY
jgi:guanine deaminase